MNLRRFYAAHLDRKYLEPEPTRINQTRLSWLDKRAARNLGVSFRSKGIDDTDAFWNLGDDVGPQVGLDRQNFSASKSYTAYWGWFSANIDLIGNNVAQSALTLRNKTNGDRVEDHILLDLLDDVNSYSDGFELLRLTIVYLELTGNAFWHLLRNGAGVIKQIEWLRPDKFQEFIFENAQITGYKFRNQFTGRTVDIPEADIVHFKYPNPLNAFWGMGTLQKAVYSYNENLFMQMHSTSRFENEGRPDAIITQDKSVFPGEAVQGQETLDAFYEKWDKRYGGPRNVGRPGVLAPGMDIKLLSNTLAELEYIKGRELTREDFGAIFGGVPLSKLGLEKTPNRATAEVSDYTFSKDVLSPRLAMLERKLNSVPGGLTYQFDKRLLLVFEDVIPRDKEFDLRADEVYSRIFVKVSDEIRKQRFGLDPIEGFDGSVPWGPLTTAPLSEENTTEGGGND